MILRIQTEMQSGIELPNTTAGRALRDQLAEQREKHEREISEL